MPRPHPLPATAAASRPRPTGDLHFGSLLAAFGSWLLARAAGGDWLVRVEDVDPPREVAGAAQRQLAGAGRVRPACRTSRSCARAQRGDALRRPRWSACCAAGDAFECHCSRSDLAASGGMHRRCVADAATRRPGDPPARARRHRDRFDDALQGRVSQDVAREVGDFVLRRADGYWAYQLAVVVDDAAQGITDVVRGADLLDSTPRQILLQRALGLPTPRYAHLPLVRRRRRPQAVQVACRAAGRSAADPLPALRAAWRALGQDPAVLAGAGHACRSCWHARAPRFDPARIPRHGPR